MIVKVSSSGWIPDKGRNEFGLSVEILGNDEIDVAHIQSMVNDDFAVENVRFEQGALHFDVSASRKISLEEQARMKAESDAVKAKEKEEADKKFAEEQRKQQFEAAAQQRAEEMRIEQRAREILKTTS